MLQQLVGRTEWIVLNRPFRPFIRMSICPLSLRSSLLHVSVPGETSPSGALTGRILGSDSDAPWKNGSEHAPPIKCCHLPGGARLLPRQARKPLSDSPNWLYEALGVPLNTFPFIVS